MPARRAWVPVLASLLFLSSAAADPPAPAKDAAGDPLPPGATARLGTTRYRTPGSSWQLTLTPDGKSLGYRAADGQIALMDVSTGAVARTLSFGSARADYGLVFAPDGKRAALVSYNGVHLVELDTGKQIGLVKTSMYSRSAGAPAASFSADGNRVAVGSDRRGPKEETAAVVWDVAAGKAVGSFTVLQNENVFATLSADGKTLATWGRHFDRGGPGPGVNPNAADSPGRVVQVWDVDNQAERAKVKVEGYSVNTAALSPDGKLLAVAAGSTAVEVFEAATGKSARLFAGRGVASQLHFSPDGRWLAALTTDGAVQVWDVAGGKRVAVVDSPVGAVSGLVFTGNDRAVAWGSRSSMVAVWEVPSGKRLTPTEGHTAAVTSVTFAAGGKTVLTGGSDGLLTEWEFGAARPVKVTPVRVPDRVRAGGGYVPPGGTVTLAPDGTHLVLTNTITGPSAAAYVFDRATGAEVMTLSTGWSDGRSMAPVFSADGSRVFFPTGRYSARGGDTTRIPVWDIASGQRAAELTVPAGESMAGAFSPDGTRAVTAVVSRTPPPAFEYNLTLTGWDVKTGAKLGEWSESRVSGAPGVAVAPDNRTAVLAVGGRVTAWDLVTGRVSREMGGPMGGYGPYPIAFSPDGRLVAVAGSASVIGAPGAPPAGLVPPGVVVVGSGGRVEGVIRVYEWASGTVRQEFRGHAATVSAVAFAPDGRSLVSGGYDTTALVWDLTRPPGQPDPALADAPADELWAALDAESAAAAFPAVAALAARPADAAAVVRKNLKPADAPKLDPDGLRRLIGKLGDEAFATREEATKAIEAVGPDAVPFLKDALPATRSPEAARRIGDLLTRLDRPGPTRDMVRPARAVEVLERAGTPEARAVLKELAGGHPGHPLTGQAKAALARLGGK